ncbi:hypothetical protein TrCOL_g12363, partial [Triparma columacea]
YIPYVASELTVTDTGCTDASGLGMGGHFAIGDTTYIWRLPFEQLVADSMIRSRGDGGSITINELELLAILAQNMLLHLQWSARGLDSVGRVALTYSDNTAAVAATGKFRLRSRAGLKMVKALSQHAADNGYVARAMHIAGVKNVAADFLSRNLTRTGDVEINPEADPVPDDQLPAVVAELLNQRAGATPITASQVVLVDMPQHVHDEIMSLLQEALESTPWTRRTEHQSAFHYGHHGGRVGIVGRFREGGGGRIGMEGTGEDRVTLMVFEAEPNPNEDARD